MSDFMRLNEDKISHISHLLTDGVLKEGFGQTSEPSRMLKIAKQIITDYCRMDEEVDAVVRKKLKSYARNLAEGSREWDVLYRKHFDEEIKKRWR